jgi:hypothetical protein
VAELRIDRDGELIWAGAAHQLQRLFFAEREIRMLLG